MRDYLIVTNFSVPANTTWGETIPITWTVKNQGNYATSVNWSDYIYVSADTSLDVNDTLVSIVAKPNNDPLGASQSYTNSQSLTIPDSTVGKRYLLIVANRDKQQAEVNATNNNKAVEIGSGEADLVVSQVVVPANTNFGDTVPLSWTVTNRGNAPALVDSWFDYIYASSDGNLDKDSTLIGYVKVNNKLAPLAAGDSYTITQNFTIPLGASGKPYLLFVTDRENYQRESIDSNNINSFTLNTSDLVATNLNAPTTATLGETILVSWTVTNQGGLATTGSWTDGIYLSNKSTFDDSAVLVGQATTGATQVVAGGGSYTQNASITLPSNFTGQPYLFVVSNYQKQLIEAGYGNNIQGLPLNVQAPDLVVTNFNAPATIAPGEVVNLSWTVKNQGNYPTDVNRRDRVYLSTDDTVGGDDIIIADLDAIKVLQSGDIYTLSTQITIPQIDPSKTWKLLLKTDANANQAELNEGNNLAIASVSVVAPDLQVENFGVVGNTPLVFGSSNDINWTVRNIGQATATQSWRDRVYLSRDNQIDGNDLLLANELVSGLVAGSSYTKTTQINLPQNWNSGDYYLLLQTNADSQQAEADKSNNAKTLNVSIAEPPVPDLIVTQISAPSRELSGQRLQVSWQVKNQGTAAATGSWTDSLFLSNTNNPNDPSRRAFGNYTFTGTIEAGQTITRTQEITLPIDWNGDRWITVETDSLGQVYERSGENNNITVSSQPTNVELSPFPNLQVTSAIGPTSVFAGQQAVVSWTVSNTGTGGTNAAAWADQVWLSLDSTVDTGDILVGTAANLSYLNPGENYTNTLNVNLPERIAASYYFLVRSDSNNTVDEYNRENDNIGISNPIEVKPVLPVDLQVTKVVAPTQTFSGQTISLNWQVNNLGQNKTRDNVSWSDEVWMSTDDVLDGSDRSLGKFVRPGDGFSPLNPGESYTNTQLVSLPIGVSGNYYFFVRTDSSDLIYERGYESNNAGFGAVPSIISLTPPPDLEVESLDVTSNLVRAGQSLKINYQVANNGSTTTPNYSWTDGFYLSTDAVLDTGGVIKSESKW